MPDIMCRCGKQLNIPATAVGRLGKCPSCHQPLRMIASDEQLAHNRLIIESAPARVGEQLILGGPGPLEIGKLPGKHILLNAPGISRSHCRLVRASDGWSIEDQNSTNGIFVNDQRVRQHHLANGDRVRIGEITLLFQSDGKAAPASISAESDQEEFLDAPLDNDDLYRLTEGDSVETAPEPPQQRLELMPPIGDGPICPGCQKQFPAGAKICTSCGIDLKTGKPILTAYDADLDTVYTRAESIIAVISWIIWCGLYPIASEGFGTRRPYFTWAIVTLTVFTSVWFWAYEWTGSPVMQEIKDYMLWAGDVPPTADQINFYYWFTSYGDREAFEQKLDQIAPENRKGLKAPQLDDAFGNPADVMEAYTALRPVQRCLGGYRPGQLFTHAFIHGGLMHLIGNMLFLFVIGSRVNALIGNLATMAIYPLLAMAGGWAYLVSAQGQPPHPLIGASGAIMGLAGMYFVLMPLHKVHMAFWYRLGLLFRFELHMKLFAVRGFWVVLFYIAYDVLYTIFGIEDEVAHWAHLGGFIAGIGIGLALLLTRMVNCRGGDILSALLRRRAWLLVGRPDSTRKSIIASWF